MPDGGGWAEIGCYRGRSLAAVTLAAARNALVIGIDPFVPVFNDPNGPGTTMTACKETVSELQKLRGDVTLNLLIERSLNVPARYIDFSLDAVFIDGAHDETSVDADLRSWHRKVRPGGLICGHDREDMGVRKALARFFVVPVREGPGTIWFVRVPQELDADVVDTLAEEDQQSPAMHFVLG
jgi:hypothetical protein